MTRARLARSALITAAAMAVATPALLGAARLPHLKLRAIFPGKDSTLTTAPEAVKLWLSEPADLPATRIAVTAANGALVATAKPTRGAEKDAPILARFTAPPGDGKYTISWKAMSKDGHVVSGVSAFTVKLAR